MPHNAAPKSASFNHPYQRTSIAFFFAVSGFAFSNWAVRIPDIRDNLHLNVAEIGLLLLCSVVGSFVLTLLSSFLILKFGSRLTTCVGSYCCVLALALIGGSSSRYQLGSALVLFGASMGLMNISMNDQAAHLERRYQRSIMSSFHGIFSLAGMLGSLLGGLLASLQIKPFYHLGSVALLIALGTLFSQHLLIAPDQTKTVYKSTLFTLPQGQLWWIGIIAAAAVFVEGSMADWSSLFLVALGAHKGFAALGLAFFTGAMAVGRLFGDRWIEKLGPLLVLQIGGLLGFLGISIAIFFPNPYVGLFGFTLTGLGMATLFPCLLSLAGRNKTMPPSAAIASVAMMGYFSLLAGPPLLGFLAHAIGLRWAFVALLLSAMLVFLMAKPATR